MLRKQIKYDFKALMRILLPLFGGVLALSLLGAVALRITTGMTSANSSITGTVFTFVATFFVMIAAILVMSCTLITLLIAALRYYRDLTCDEGYLTFTLPVTPGSILTSKLITGFVSVLISLIVTLISLLLLLYIGTADLPELFTAIREGLSALFMQLASGWDGLCTLCFVLAVMTVLVCIVQTLLTVYTSITLGSKFTRKYRLLAAVAFYFMLNLILNILEIPVISLLYFQNYNVSDPLLVLTRLIGIQLIYMAVISVVCFMVTRRLLSKNLNLE